MMQAHPVPDVHARGSLAVEDVTGRTVALLGACKRADQIQLRAGIDHPADAAQHAVHFAERPESIDINGYEARGLHEQFFVGHEGRPRRVTGAHPRIIVTSARQESETQPRDLSGTSARLTRASNYHLPFIPISSESSPDAIAPAGENCPPVPPLAGAVIPEAGPCGFDFSSWGEA